MVKFHYIMIIYQLHKAFDDFVFSRALAIEHFFFLQLIDIKINSRGRLLYKPRIFLGNYKQVKTLNPILWKTISI